VVDAFLQRWDIREWLWLLPPIPVIAKVVNKVMRERAKVVIVIPMWMNRPWWPLLFDGKGHARREVRGWKVIEKGELIMGKYGRPWFLTRPVEGWRTPFVALSITPWTEGELPRDRPVFCANLYFSGKCRHCRP
jgi:hypothetical protein